MDKQIIIIPNSLIAHNHGKFAFQRDSRKKEILKDILNTPNAVFVFNIDGTIPGGKKQHLKMDWDFFEILPKNADIEFNISNFFNCNIWMTNSWNPEHIDSLKFNFSDIDLNELTYWKEPLKIEAPIKHFELNLGNCHTNMLLHGSDIENIKITQEKFNNFWGQFTQDNNGGLAYQDTDKWIDYNQFNSIKLTGLSNCKTIDFTNFPNMRGSNLHYDKVNNNCLWKFGNDIQLNNVKKDFDDIDEFTTITFTARKYRVDDTFTTQRLEEIKAISSKKSKSKRSL